MNIADLMKGLTPQSVATTIEPIKPIEPITPITPIELEEQTMVDEPIEESIDETTGITMPTITSGISDFLNENSDDIQSSMTFEDPLEYMERIENMPPLEQLLEELIEHYEPDCPEANEINVAIEKLAGIENDINREFVEVENIMQAIQSSPEYIRYINPANYTLLFNRLSALTEVKVEATKVKSEKLKVTKERNKKAKKFKGILEGLSIASMDTELDDDIIIVED